MNSNPKLSYAIAAILSGAAPSLGLAAAATTDADTNSDSIQEITVTAQRRVESMQDVPISIQAITGAALEQLNVTTFEDFIKYLPNVTAESAGPGQSSIFMRGVSSGVTGEQGTGTTGPIPNVAVYLDEQSGALPGRNLDVYAADLERIEVLEGPQGTLFGSGAEAGVLRYITNKPKLDVTEGNVNAGYSYTAHGDPNSSVDAMINLPLIPTRWRSAPSSTTTAAAATSTTCRPPSRGRAPTKASRATTAAWCRPTACRSTMPPRSAMPSIRSPIRVFDCRAY